MTSISSISASSLLAAQQADELLRQQQLRDALKTSMDAAAKSLNMTASSLKAALKTGESLKDIASSKGVDFAKVQTAISSAVQPQLDQAVQAGTLTSAQATDVLAKLTSGNATTQAAQSVKGHGGHHGHHGGGKVVQSADDAAAKALDMTPSALQTALQSGQTLQDVAASKNVDFAKVQSAITDAVKPQLDQAVQSGRLTGSQEQDLISKLTSADAASNPSATYSTSGSVSQPTDPGLLVNTTA
jgi:hypothetical protein